MLIIQSLSLEELNNYAVLDIPSGMHEITLYLNNHPKLLAANSRVRADVGKVAMVNGPMVYCLEEIDNGKNLTELYVNADTVFEEMKPLDRFPGEVPIFCYEGARVDTPKVKDDVLYGEALFEKKPVKIKAVPYAFWNNRGIGEMKVWQNVLV